MLPFALRVPLLSTAWSDDSSPYVLCSVLLVREAPPPKAPPAKRRKVEVNSSSAPSVAPSASEEGRWLGQHGQKALPFLYMAARMLGELKPVLLLTDEARQAFTELLPQINARIRYVQ